MKWLELKKIAIRFKLCANFEFFSFLKTFLAFTRLKSFKLGLFGMKLGTEHYLVDIIFEIFKIENNRHMREITCKSQFLWYFKLSRHLLA